MRFFIAIVAIIATFVSVPAAAGIESNSMWLTDTEMANYKAFCLREDPSGNWLAIVNDKIYSGWWLHWTRPPLPESLVRAITERDLVAVRDPVLRAELVHMFTFKVIHLGYQYCTSQFATHKELAYLAYQVWTCPSKEWWIRTKPAVPAVVQPPCPSPAVQAPPMEPEPARRHISFVPPWTDGLAQSAGSEQALNSRMIRPGLLDGGLGGIIASAVRRPSTTKLSMNQSSALDSNVDVTTLTTVEIQNIIDILNQLSQAQNQPVAIAID